MQGGGLAALQRLLQLVVAKPSCMYGPCPQNQAEIVKLHQGHMGVLSSRLTSLHAFIQQNETNRGTTPLNTSEQPQSELGRLLIQHLDARQLLVTASQIKHTCHKQGELLL